MNKIEVIIDLIKNKKVIYMKLIGDNIIFTSDTKIKIIYERSKINDLFIFLNNKTFSFFNKLLESCKVYCNRIEYNKIFNINVYSDINTINLKKYLEISICKKYFNNNISNCNIWIRVCTPRTFNYYFGLLLDHIRVVYIYYFIHDIINFYNVMPLLSKINIKKLIKSDGDVGIKHIILRLMKFRNTKFYGSIYNKFNIKYIKESFIWDLDNILFIKNVVNIIK